MVKTRDLFRAWGQLLCGRRPALSIEITKECPLRCPGCYAFAPDHVAPGTGLKSLADLRGDALVENVLALVRRHHPLHVSIVGGDPLVRYRELEVIVPEVLAKGIFVQIVTSAFRPLPLEWVRRENLELVVSIDGLENDHNLRRAPATYERILKNIAGHQVVVHCTVTAKMLRRAGYLDDFVDFWSANRDVKKIWMSIFTPQRGEELEEIPSPSQRERIIADLRRLREIYPKLDMPRGLLEQLASPPASPEACVFARTTTVISADLKTPISPCQFGGDPDCSRCGCIASMGLAAIADYKLAGRLTAGHVFEASVAIGRQMAKVLPN